MAVKTSKIKQWMTNLPLKVFHVLHVPDGFSVCRELSRLAGQLCLLDNRVQHHCHLLICVLGDQVETLISAIYVEQHKKHGWKKVPPFARSLKYRDKIVFPFIFSLTFIAPVLRLHPGSVASDRCLLLILIYLPLLHPPAPEVSTGPVLGGGGRVGVRGFACVEMMSALQSE